MGVIRAAAIGLVAAGTYAQPSDPFEPLLHAPPVLWAKPYIHGPVRVSFIVDHSAASELNGLLARFDIEPTICYFQRTSDAVEFPTNIDDYSPRKRTDVIVVSGVTLDDLPDELKRSIENCVSRGAGYVNISAPGASPEWPTFVSHDLRDVTNAAIVEPKRTMWLSDYPSDSQPVRTYTSDSSRFVALRWLDSSQLSGVLLPHCPTDALNAPSTLEDYYAILGRAILWAANEQNAVRISSIEDRSPEGPDAVSTPPQLPKRFVERMRRSRVSEGARQFVVRLDRPAPRSYRVRTQVRHPYRDIRWEHSVEERLRKGETYFELALPVGMGPSYVDVWLDDGLEVEDWFTTAFDVPGWPAVYDVELPPAHVDPNDRLLAALVVEPDFYRQQASGMNPRSAGVFARSVDPLGRVVNQRLVEAGEDGGPVRIDMPIVDLLSPYLRFELHAAPSTDIPLNWWVRERSAYAASHTVVREPWRSSMQVIADLPGDGSYASRLRRITARNAGVSVAHTTETEPALGSIAADGLVPLGSLTGNAEIDCDPQNVWSPKGRAALFQYAEQFRPFRSDLFTMRVGASPCAETIESALRSQFSSLDSFNSTQTGISESWTIASNRVAFAATPDAATIRSRVIADSAFALRDSALTLLGDVVPKPKVLIDARDTVASRLILSTSSGPAVVSEDTLSLAIVRSRHRSGHEPRILRANVPPAGRDGAWARWIPWIAAVQGIDALWLAATEPRSYPLDTLQDHEAIEPFIESLDRLTMGFDKLFDVSEPVNADVLLLLSHHDLLGTSDLGALLEAWESALARVGTSMDVAFADRVSSDALATYSSIVVPRSASMPPEIDPILLQHVERGGTIFSDRNMAWSTHPIDNDWLTPDPPRKTRQAFESQLKSANIPFGKASNVEVSRSFSGQFFQHRMGAAHVYTFLHAFHAKDHARAEVRGDERHVYAPLSQPGVVDRSHWINIEPGEVAVFCTLPYEVSRVAIDAPTLVGMGSRLDISLVVRSIGDLPDDHVLAVQLFDPAGEELRHYRRILVADAGHAEGYIPLAFNETEGVHTLRATDILTGVVSEIDIEIR